MVRNKDAPIHITFDAKKSLFKKCIGRHRGRDGTLKPRIFWLGRVQHTALARARIYQQVWEEIQDCPRDFWTDEDEAEAKRRIEGGERWQQLVEADLAERIAKTLQTANRLRGMVNPDMPEKHVELQAAEVPPPIPATTTPQACAPSETMLYEALDAYVKAMQAKALSSSYKSRIAETVGALKHYRSDVPMARIDRLWLEEVTDFIKSRPPVRSKRKAKASTRPIGPQ